MNTYKVTLLEQVFHTSMIVAETSKDAEERARHLWTRGETETGKQHLITHAVDKVVNSPDLTQA